jgi:hypothetical protein
VFLQELKTDLNDIQKEVALTAGRVRENVLRAWNATTNAIPIIFEVGDYILVWRTIRELLTLTL